MAQQAMTIRLDSEIKNKFDTLCEQFGMSANTAINIFVNAVVRSKSIPFSISVSEQSISTQDRAKQAFKSIRKKAESSKDPEMTLEDINDEIRKIRESHK